MELFERLFAYVCGSANVCNLNGELLPFCQRCTGLYVGGIVALVVYAAFRPRPTPRMLWLHGALLFGMVPFGYHWVPQNSIVRTVSGFLFACGIVYYLLLIPFERAKVSYGDGWKATFAFLLMALFSLLFTLSFGGPPSARAITLLGFLGLLSFVLLAGDDVWCLVLA